MRTAIRTCPLCEATCGLTLEVDDETRTVGRVRGDADDVFSRGFLCPKGVAIKELHEDPDRVRTPLLRQPDGSFVEATWDERRSRSSPRSCSRSRPPAIPMRSPPTSATRPPTTSARSSTAGCCSRRSGRRTSSRPRRSTSTPSRWPAR